MNNRLRDGLNALAKGTSTFFGNLCQTIVSVMRMWVLSSLKVARESKNYQNLRQSDMCCVLGNGPSLKQALEEGRVQLNGDVMAVNMFCSSEFFSNIKPRFYFLVDGAYFAPKNERHTKLVDELTDKFNAIDWDMYLIVSSGSVYGGILQYLKNSHVKVLRMNSTTFDGFRNIRHFFYRHRMAMPRCQTVINFALGTAIAMNYRKILLYGADHTWLRDLSVNDDNIVCYGDRHVYSTGLTVIQKKDNLSKLLRQFAYMFESHELIAEYAESVGNEILNCTKGSFIDAYKRMIV